jgi:hypothetical protein
MNTDLIEWLTQHKEIVKDFVVPLASALIGAIAGAAAGYWPARQLAKRSSDEILKRDAGARHEGELRAARQVYVKLHTVANSIGTYHKQVEEMIAKADVDGNTHMLIWQRLSVFPAIGREPNIEFSAEELALYIAAKQPEFMDDLLLLARKHAANLGSLAAFATMKSDLHSEMTKFGSTTRAESGVSTTRLRVPPELANHFEVKGDELENFAKMMRGCLAEDYKFVCSVAGRFTEVTESYLGEKTLPGFASATEIET